MLSVFFQRYTCLSAHMNLTGAALGIMHSLDLCSDRVKSSEKKSSESVAHLLVALSIALLQSPCPQHVCDFSL